MANEHTLPRASHRSVAYNHVMSALLSCHGLSKAFAERPLFQGLTFAVQDGDKLGLIGANGTGKSTLLQVLAQRLDADDGEVVIRKGATVAYVAQEDTFEPGLTVEEAITQGLEGTALDTYERETRARIVLGRFGFPDPAIKAETLSGGWRKRLALARALALEPDLLLLDEPTNHLDVAGIEWLEGFLASAKVACLVITHDRVFLERAVNQVMELGRKYPDGFLRVSGTYSTFLLRRDELITAQLGQENRLANQVRREVEWLRRGPRGRGTKAKDRIKSAHKLMDTLDTVKDRNAAGGKAQIAIESTGRRANWLIRAKKIKKSLGGKLLVDGLDFELGPGERVGLVGENGSGKTTLIRMLTGDLEPDAGEVTTARNLKIEVFSQHRAQLDPDDTLKEALSSDGEQILYRGKSVHVTGWAKRFLFDEEQLNTRVGTLSGGEQARILIANLVRRPADLLLLDEPTNDLDLPTREVLEESLAEFPGALILVTHDRYLLDRVSTQILGLTGDGGVHHLADRDQWERLQKERVRALKQAAKAASKAPAATERRATKTVKLSYKEKQEWEGMEAAINGAEEAVTALEAKSVDATVLEDHKALEKVHSQLHDARQVVEGLYARWEALEAKQQPQG
jgi:ABC transport system ATP-binding/permease protein